MSTGLTTPELVIGIGASAGGLRALEAFFQAMPCDSGCAFVVVQHLSPDFKSLMNDLLARHTRMQIHRVEDGMMLERDCIYLIPPRKLMTVTGGKLTLTEREAARQLEFPINVFLDSLAADYGPQAVAIILSGTGTDGTQGVRSVHEAGGLIIVQSLDSADFNGMPRSAINTELADYVLAPERMPEAVITYAKYPNLRMVQNAGALAAHGAPGSFTPIFEQLHRTYGIDFGEYKIPTVQRRIHRRMSFLQLEDVSAYAQVLTENTTELDDLYKDLLIGVTEFTRDPESFETLGRDVLPKLIGEANPEEFRVWVAACATGEEAYSLAILVDEQVKALGYTGRVTIFATDVHRYSLARAQAGVYERVRLENLGSERISRYFKEEPNGHMRVVPELRQRIIFSAHNVISDPPFTKIDLISCRNMLIYLQPATQERVLAMFHFALRRNGALFLGSSEGLGGVEGGFSPLAVRHKIYRKSTDSLIVPPEIRALASARTLRSVAAPLKGVSASTITVSRALLQSYDYLLKEAMPPSFLIAENGEIVQYFDKSSRFLLPPEGRSHDNLFNRTDGDLRLALTTIISKAAKTGQPVLARGIRHRSEDGEHLIDVQVKPIPDDRNETVLLHVALLHPREAPPRLAPSDGPSGADTFESQPALDRRLRELELELQTTKENLQTTVEELQTSNEELQATNEELLAANEELQSTNEELHSVNEELYTVNAEFERKNHELKTIGEDLQNLLASTDIGTLFLDRNLRIRRFTPAIARIFHLLPQDISRPIDHLAHHLEGETNLIQSLRDVLTTGNSLEREIRTRDGNWLFQRILPFRTAEEKIDGVVMTFTDISGIKSVQDKLNLSLEFSRMAWWEWDLDAQVLNTHNSGQPILGFAGPSVTMTSTEWMSLVHAEDLERVKHSHDSCLNGEAARWECQHRFLSRDGQWRWVVNKGKISARDSSGRPQRMLGTTQDVHERVIGEMEIKKLNLALERSPVMVVITDLDGRIEYVNQQFSEVTGYSASEVIGQNPRILKSGEMPEAVYRDLWATLKRSEVWQGELQNRRKDGRLFWERATIGLLKDADGRGIRYVALKEEITSVKSADDEQRHVEEQLAHVKKMETLGALAGGIAHDFNNILTAIVSHTEIAADLTPPNHPATESLQHVRQASRRATELVQRILSFSSRGPSTREKLNLGTLVTEVASLLRASIPTTVRIDLSLGAADLFVLANPTDIQQVILNLGSNAAHAMRERGGVLAISLEPCQLERPLKVTIGTLGAGEYRCLRIADTGTGIAPQVAARMFDPFFTTKRMGEGTGLGLSIVLGIVLAHGGAIEVRSKIGEGTTFEIYLPAATGDDEGAGDEEPIRTTGSGQRIAIVDDEVAITEAGRLALSRNGYVPTTFNRAQELLDFLAAGGKAFDLIITDQTMPGMTGLELIRTLRDSGNARPVIILSGNARFVSQEDLADLGDVKFMPKPFEISGLMERISVMLSLAR